ncbi:MAG: right-handed parallel beta-helix repeat-containing protein, partial [Acidobacteriota bacterium]|nr:right-handed parallel beta-helix repeat-containing protein [Acidobacteriota bacterium]
MRRKSKPGAGEALVRLVSLAMLVCLGSGTVEAKAPKPTAVVVAVSPQGNDAADGSVAHPVRTLEQAQRLVRRSNTEHDVQVQLAPGVYRLQQALVFRAADGGRNGHTVEWTAAPCAAEQACASPVISGALRVTHWLPYNQEGHIFVADTPIGLEARELWVNGHLASRTAVELARKQLQFTRQGVTVSAEAQAVLAELAKQPQRHLELFATGYFTSRVAPVARMDGNTLVMQQPAWQNNLWGYDTIEDPFGPESAHLYLVNSLALLRHPGEWYLDPERGKLYLWPAEGVSLDQADVELPRLTTLVAVGDSIEDPVQDLAIRGITFSYTSWLGPSSPEGYASQQSGSYLAGRAAYPDDPIGTCSKGCPAFETVRNDWSQMPASVQVAAAQRITLDQDTFAHLGQYALGIGNDADANLNQVGLGTSDITVSRCLFQDGAGGAILAGGVQRDAHHPHDRRLLNRELIVENNRVEAVSQEYRDNSAILETYFDQAQIVHNEIANVPYDAIDIGYGWGMHDAGGNSNYRVRMHGYDSPQNLIYTT